MYCYDDGIKDNEFYIVVERENDENVTMEQVLECLWDSIDFCLTEPEDGYGTPINFGNDHVAFALIVDFVEGCYTGYVDYNDVDKLNESGNITLTLYKES